MLHEYLLVFGELFWRVVDLQQVSFVCFDINIAASYNSRQVQRYGNGTAGSHCCGSTFAAKPVLSDLCALCLQRQLLLNSFPS